MNQTLTYNDIRNISVSIRLSVCFSLSLHLGLSLALYSPFSMDLSASVGLHWLSLYVTAFVSICLSLLSRSSHCPCPPACLPVCLSVSLPQLPVCLSVCLILSHLQSYMASMLSVSVQCASQPISSHEGVPLNRRVVFTYSICFCKSGFICWN